jgi:hypothetical protein
LKLFINKLFVFTLGIRRAYNEQFNGTRKVSYVRSTHSLTNYYLARNWGRYARKQLYMKSIAAILVFMLFSVSGYSAENKLPLNMTCQDYSWNDVETLVKPYLDETLFTALVMQGQSSNYETSAAAIQAMDKSLPDVVKRILQSLINAGC